MPDEYFQLVAASGLRHINVSIESQNPSIYERMRKGARHRIFLENWERLLAAFPSTPTPPQLRYIIMAYRSNLQEIPQLVNHLLEQRLASQVEVRDTYDMPHIPKEFKADEFLSHADWHWLQAQLADHSVHKVALLLPPNLPAEAAPNEPPTPEPAQSERSASEPIAEATPLESLTDSGSHPDSSPPASVSVSVSVSADDDVSSRSARVPGLFEVCMSYNGQMAICQALAGDGVAERGGIVKNILEVEDPLSLLDSVEATA
jgi:hypothetical protein